MMFSVMCRRIAVSGSALVLFVLSGCAGLSSSGPNKTQVNEAQPTSNLPMQVIALDEPVVKRLLAAEKRVKFSDVFESDKRPGYRVGAGDVLEISIWEAPPATLFGGNVMDPRLGLTTTRATSFPEQMVSYQGTINIPFAGAIPAAGKSPQEIEAEVAKRLAGKANQPQVLVRVNKNTTSNVTVVGEVGQSGRLPLTASGERLLDAIASAGGVRQPVGKVTIQLTRNDVVQSMPLDSIILDPKQNVTLQPGDVLTALFQPHSFMALGATGKNEEILFETQGITLAQALARTGGLQDQRADAKGVFVFRFEEPLVLGVASDNPDLTPDGKVPAIYSIDLKDPKSFFLAQSFPVRNRDILYVASAPAAELQKFLNILTSVVFTATGLRNIGQ